MSFLDEHVARFNAGVRSGDWGPMVEHFAPEAKMEFRGIAVGPFVGREAIAEAYRNQPPDDEMRVLEQRDEGDRIEARYAWLAEPDVAAGELFITREARLIIGLVVTFDRGVTWGDE